MYDICLKVSGDALDLEVPTVLKTTYNLGLLCTDEYYELYYVIPEEFEDRGREEAKFMKARRSSFALTNTGMLRALSYVQCFNLKLYFVVHRRDQPSGCSVGSRLMLI